MEVDSGRVQYNEGDGEEEDSSYDSDQHTHVADDSDDSDSSEGVEPLAFRDDEEESSYVENEGETTIGNDDNDEVDNPDTNDNIDSDGKEESSHEEKEDESHETEMGSNKTMEADNTYTNDYIDTNDPVRSHSNNASNSDGGNNAGIDGDDINQRSNNDTLLQGDRENSSPPPPPSSSSSPASPSSSLSSPPTLPPDRKRSRGAILYNPSDSDTVVRSLIPTSSSSATYTTAHASESSSSTPLHTYAITRPPGESERIKTLTKARKDKKPHVAFRKYNIGGGKGSESGGEEEGENRDNKVDVHDNDEDESLIEPPTASTPSTNTYKPVSTSKSQPTPSKSHSTNPDAHVYQQESGSDYEINNNMSGHDDDDDDEEDDDDGGGDEQDRLINSYSNFSLVQYERFIVMLLKMNDTGQAAQVIASAQTRYPEELIFQELEAELQNVKEGGVLNAKHQSKSSGNGDFPEKKKREKNAGNSNKDHRSPNMHKKPIFNQRSSYSHVTSRLYYNTPRKKREHTSGDDEQDFNNANADINLDTLVKGGRGRGGGGSNKGGWKELNYDHRQKENERRRTRAERLRKVREEREKRRAMEKTWREEWEEEKKEVERKRKVKGCKRKFFFNRPLGPAALRRKKRSLKKSLKKSRNKSNQRQNQQRSGGHSENDSEVSSDDSDDDDFKKQIKQVRRMRGKSSTNKNKKNNKLSSKKRKMKKKPSSKYDECDAGDSSRPSWNTKWSATEGGKLFDAYQLKSVSVEYDDDEGVYFGPFNSPISAPASPISKTASAVTSPLASSSLSLSPSQQLSLDREGGGSRSRKPVIYNSPGGRAQVRDSDKKHFNADSADFFSSQMSKLRVNGAKDTDRGSKGDSKIRTDSNDDGSNDGDGKNVITERRRRREEGSLLVTISNQGESETKDERTSTEIIKATGGNSTANEQKSTQDYTTPKRIRKGRGSSGSDCSSAGGTLDGASSSVHTLVQSHYVIGSQTDRSHDRTKRQHHAASPISGIANTPTQKPPALPRELHLNLQQVHSNNPSIKLAPGALINANSYLIKKQYRERQLYLQHQLEHSPLPAHARDPSYRHSYHSPRIHSEHSQQLQGKHGRNNNSSRRRQNHHHLSDNFAAKQPYVSPRSPSQSNASTSTTPSFSSRKSRDVYEVVPCLSSRMIREQALRQVHIRERDAIRSLRHQRVNLAQQLQQQYDQQQKYKKKIVYTGSKLLRPINRSPSSTSPIDSERAGNRNKRASRKSSEKGKLSKDSELHQQFRVASSSTVHIRDPSMRLHEYQRIKAAKKALVRNKKETARKKREEEAKKWKEKHASLREDLHIHHHSHHDHMSPESPPTASTEYSHSHAHASGTAIPSPHPPLVKKMQHVSRFERDKRARKEQEEQHKEKIKKVPELSKDSNSRLLQPTKAHEMKLRKQKEEDEKKSRERKEKESKIIQPMLTFSSPPAKKKRLKDDDIGNDTNPEEDDDMEEGNVTTPLKNSKRGRGENTKLSQGKSKSKSKSKSKRRTPQPPTIGRNANKRSAASPRRNRLESIIDELPSPRRRAEEDRKDSGSRKRSKQSGASPRRNRLESIISEMNYGGEEAEKKNKSSDDRKILNVDRAADNKIVRKIDSRKSEVCDAVGGDGEEASNNCKDDDKNDEAGKSKAQITCDSKTNDANGRVRDPTSSDHESAISAEERAGDTGERCEVDGDMDYSARPQDDRSDKRKPGRTEEGSITQKKEETSDGNGDVSTRNEGRSPRSSVGKRGKKGLKQKFSRPRVNLTYKSSSRIPIKDSNTAGKKTDSGGEINVNRKSSIKGKRASRTLKLPAKSTTLSGGGGKRAPIKMTGKKASKTRKGKVSIKAAKNSIRIESPLRNTEEGKIIQNIAKEVGVNTTDTGSDEKGGNDSERDEIDGGAKEDQPIDTSREIVSVAVDSTDVNSGNGGDGNGADSNESYGEKRMKDTKGVGRETYGDEDKKMKALVGKEVEITIKKSAAGPSLKVSRKTATKPKRNTTTTSTKKKRDGKMNRSLTGLKERRAQRLREQKRMEKGLRPESEGGEKTEQTAHATTTPRHTENDNDNDTIIDNDNDSDNGSSKSTNGPGNGSIRRSGDKARSAVTEKRGDHNKGGEKSVASSQLLSLRERREQRQKVRDKVKDTGRPRGTTSSFAKSSTTNIAKVSRNKAGAQEKRLVRSSTLKQRREQRKREKTKQATRSKIEQRVIQEEKEGGGKETNATVKRNDGDDDSKGGSGNEESSEEEHVIVRKTKTTLKKEMAEGDVSGNAFASATHKESTKSANKEEGNISDDEGDMIIKTSIRAPHEVGNDEDDSDHDVFIIRSKLVPASASVAVVESNGNKKASTSTSAGCSGTMSGEHSLKDGRCIYCNQVPVSAPDGDKETKRSETGKGMRARGSILQLQDSNYALDRYYDDIE